jgi:hypothetical protein
MRIKIGKSNLLPLEDLSKPLGGDPGIRIRLPHSSGCPDYLPILGGESSRRSGVNGGLVARIGDPSLAEGGAHGTISKTSPMIRAFTIFLQISIVLLGIGVLAALLAEPQFEGRNVSATQFEIYFNDPFLAYIYAAFIPFFFGLYQAFRLVGYAGRDELFSAAAVKTVRAIKFCAWVMALLFLGAISYIFVAMSGEDDIAGGVMIGFLITLASVVTAVAARLFERVLQKSADR